MSALMRSNLRSSSRHGAASAAGAGLAAHKQVSTKPAADSAEPTRRDRDVSAIGLVSRRKQEYAFTCIASCPANATRKTELRQPHAHVLFYDACSRHRA